MQLSAHHTVRPYLVPIPEWLGGEGINAIGSAVVLGVTAGTPTLYCGTKSLDSPRLTLGDREIASKERISTPIIKIRIRDSGIILENDTFFV